MRRQRLQRGVSFIMALIVLVALSIFLAAASQRVGKTMQKYSKDSDQIKAEEAAEAGIQHAFTGLTTFNQNLLNPTTDDWALLGDHGHVNYKVGLSSFRLEIVDAGSLVNVNTAEHDQLQKMGLTDDQIDCLLDWRSAGQTPRQLGAKDETYLALEKPYNTKIRALDSIDELLLIKNFDAKTLLSPPTATNATPLNVNGVQQYFAQMVTVDSQVGNNSPTGQARTNLNTVTLAQLIQAGIAPQLATAIFTRRTTGGNFTSMAQVVQLPGMTTQAAGTLLDRYTVTTDVQIKGKININTASEAVLNSIPNLTSQAVQAIQAKQGTYTSLSDFTSSASLADIAAIADVFTTGSQVMVVRCLGKSGNRTVALEATLDMTSALPKVTRIQPVIAPDPISYWNWDRDTTSDTTLMEANSSQ